MEYSLKQLQLMAKNLKTQDFMDGKNSYKLMKRRNPSVEPIESVPSTVNISSSCVQVPASTVVDLGYEFSDSEIIPSSNVSGSFFQSGSIVEFFAYSMQKRVITQDYNFTDYTIEENTANSDTLQATSYTNAQGINVTASKPPSIPTNTLTLNPSEDLFNRGLDSGELYAVYNFIDYELASSTKDPFYVAEISGDRTEIRLKSNVIRSAEIKGSYYKFKKKLDSKEYFDEFYLSFYGNNYVVGVNCLLEEGDVLLDPSILIKLYKPLPADISVNRRCYVATKVGETIAYQVEFIQDFSDLIEGANYIKGPNVNIPLQDLVNNSTTLQSYNDLTKTNSSESLDSVLNYLNKTGVTITPDYSYNTFNEFINFSSAKQRINNFYEKISQIQSYQSDIDAIINITGSNPNVVEISQSLASLQTNITNLVANFDGYENYLYYNSSSFAYPKTGSSYPYTLLPTGSTEVLTWMGSEIESSQYYGGYRLSASLYDEDNQNWLWYTIPSFITENDNNDNYVEFSNMVGQSFDEVWLYTKALSERYNTTNDPESGLPLDLAAEAIKGLGFETFGNNYDNQDNFIGLTGEDNGIYVPPTGSELITNYVAINNGQIINYWNLGYSWLNYVEQINEPGFPYAIDKVSKEIYKRLYHNMAYLTKKKGSISGLRQLINIWGIPNTILRINEFGGKNKDNSDDYDLWYKRYSYAYTPVANQYMASSSVKVPWMPLQRNYIADANEYIVPDGVAFRFKTTGHPSSSYGGKFYSQSLAVKKSNGTNDKQMDWGIALYYEDQPSGSYSGSSFSDYYNYGKLRFYMSASTADGGVQISDDIELPFFDGGWWSVLLQRDQHTNDNNLATTYTLFAANKQVDGWDGNSLGWSGSVSMSSADESFNSGYGGGTFDTVTYDLPDAVYPTINESWNRFGITDVDGVYVGGYVSGSDVMTEVLNEGAKIFSGSFQEFRYYSNNIAKEVFNDFVMNPESVEGNYVTGSESSFDIVNFRAPLGNELEYKFTSSVSESFATKVSSSHPSITGSAPMVFTQSFIDPATGGLTSSFDFIGYEAASTYTYSKPNVETYFLDQPAIGIRNRISNKIQVSDGEDYGKVLSRYRSIDQDYLISKSYTEDITSLEVGFSPQDEVNDDIIATYGYGVISDVLADPRFAYEGKENYYPKLREIANTYFKKYTEGDVWDYLRLIKYFDNSLFKAIKSYVPARTSVTTGVIVKQHMLERNRRVPVTVNPNTIIAYSPETGSVVGGQSTATGMNSPISYRDLELTGSIDVADVKGSTGGVLNPYNVEVTQSGFFSYYSQTSPGTIPAEYINLFQSGGSVSSYADIVKSDFGSAGGIKGIRLKNPIKTRFAFSKLIATNPLDPDTGIEFAVSTSLRGIIGTDIISSASLDTTSKVASSSYYEMLPGEDIEFLIRGVNLSDPLNPIPQQNQTSYLLVAPYNINQPNANDFMGAVSPYSSSIWNSYNTQSYIVKNETISGSVYEIHKSQDEFYNGEFSGSTIVATTQSLLVNPFQETNPTNTTYNLTVTASDGAYTNSGWNTTNAAQSEFPSGSFLMKVTSSFYYNNLEGFGLDELRNYWENFEEIHAGEFMTGSLMLWQDSTKPEIWWVVGAIFPLTQFRDTNQTSIFTIPGIGMGWNNRWLNDQGVGGTQISNSFSTPNINQAPVEYSNLPDLFNEIIRPNQNGPYWKIKSISGSIDQYYAVGQNVNFATPDAGYPVDYDVIISNVLGEDGIDKFQSTTALNTIASPPQITSIAGNYGLVKYWFNEPWGRAARFVKLDTLINGPSQPNGTPEVFTQEIDVVTYVSPEQFQVSSLQDIQKSNQIDEYGAGSASLTLFGSTWTGSSYDAGQWFPKLLLFNNENIDPITGEIYNNQETLLNLPNFEIPIPNYNGNAVAVDEFGEAGNNFIQNLNIIGGLISYQDPTNQGWTGYSYDSYNSRYLSGSMRNGLIQVYNPQGPQLSQFIDFDPTLPQDSVEFFSSPYNPLINNATESVKNTYVQVVEYDNGPIPSNIEPIISQSALKARVPDSFYTQKSIINPRYLGSTLQSADYNTFTANGEDIIYLNGEITGSVFSGSNQTASLETFCFIEGTKISLMGSNTKNIEDLSPGDSILTYNVDENKQEEGNIENISSKFVDSIIKITFDDGNIIKTTEEHPFYVKDKGLVEAKDLKSLDVCKTVDETLSTITSVDKIKEDCKVYNILNVKPNHNYYANRILAHNKTPIFTTYSTTIWEGDSSPSTMPSENVAFSTISKHPIYFAHYKNSKENYELWDSTTFNIDQLIEAPLEDVRGTKAPLTPIILNVDGSNTNLTNVRSTFEVDRKAEVSYNVKTSRGISGSKFPINYSSLPVGDNKIYQGALEYNGVLSNQSARDQFTPFMAFNTGSIFGMFKITGSTLYGDETSSVFVDLLKQKPPGTGWGLSNLAGENYFLKSGENGNSSSPYYQQGYLELMGGGMTITASAAVVPNAATTYQWISGPGLGAIHSVNQCIKRRQFATNIPLGGGSDVQMGIPIGGKVIPGDNSVYFTWDVGLTGNSTASMEPSSPIPAPFKLDEPQTAINNYEDFSIPFLIEKGDEIRVAYSQSGGGGKGFVEGADDSVVFTVTDVPHAEDNTHGYAFPAGLTLAGSINSASIFNRIYVSPSPANFDIPNNEIYQFTIRRRVNADDRVIIFSTSPTGSEGVRTLSPSGYLIPGDFTPTQKRNVQTLITQLRAKNAFRGDEDNDIKRIPIE